MKNITIDDIEKCDCHPKAPCWMCDEWERSRLASMGGGVDVMIVELFESAREEDYEDRRL